MALAKRKTWNGSLQSYHLLPLLSVAWPIICYDLCIQRNAFLKPCRGLTVSRMNNLFSRDVCLKPCSTYADRNIQSCICPETKSYVSSIGVPSIYILSSQDDSTISHASRLINLPRSPSSPLPSLSLPSLTHLSPTLFSSAPSPSQPAHKLCFRRSFLAASHLMLQQSNAQLPLMIFRVFSPSLRRSKVCCLKGLGCKHLRKSTSQCSFCVNESKLGI